MSCIVGEDIWTYHNSDAISSTKLDVFHNSPLDFYEQYVAKSRQRSDATFAMDFGQAFHALQEGTAAFNAAVVDKAYADYRTKEARQWRDFQHDDGKLIVSQADRAALEIMDRRVRKHKLISLLREGAVAEATWRKSFGKFTVQCRTDVFNPNKVTLPAAGGNPPEVIGPLFLDWKVCASLRQFRKSWLDLGYARKAIFYQEVIAAVEGLPPDEPRYPFYWIAIECEPPYEIQTFRLGHKSFPIARAEVMADLKALVRCYETSEWERPEMIEDIDYPFYYAKQAETKLLAQQDRLPLGSGGVAR